MIQVKQDIPVHEIDGTDAGGSIVPPLVQVSSYWTYQRTDKWVTLIVDGTRYTVSAQDLLAAIENALNINR